MIFFFIRICLALGFFVLAAYACFTEGATSQWVHTFIICGVIWIATTMPRDDKNDP